MEKASNRQALSDRCEEFSVALQGMLREHRFAKVTSVMGAIGASKFLPKSKSVQHWFIPFDHHDWDWTMRNVDRIIQDKDTREHIKSNLEDIQSFNNEESFYWRNDSFPENQHVYFINCRSNDMRSLQIETSMLHELMHGLLRQDNKHLNQQAEELATDTFTVLAMKRLGHEQKEIFQDLFFRFRTTPKEDSNHKFILLPSTYPSLAYARELEELAEKINPNASLQKLYDMTVRFVDTCSKRKMGAWHQFCEKVETMLREGESLPAIFTAARQSRDPIMREFGNTLFQLLPHTAYIRTQAVTCNMFLEDDAFMKSHRQAQMAAFDAALEQADKQGSIKPFYEMAAHQISGILVGKGFGFAADALTMVAGEWRPRGNAEATEAIRKRFSMFLDNARHDDFSIISDLAQLYAHTEHRHQPEYLELDKAAQLSYEIDGAKRSTRDTGYTLLIYPLREIQSRFPELLPNPAELKRDFYLPFRPTPSVLAH